MHGLELRPSQWDGGAYYGTNPINGHNYSYGFYINKITTAPGKIILSGKFAINGYPVDIDSHGPERSHVLHLRGERQRAIPTPA